MSILLVTDNKDVEPWIKALKKANNALDIQIYPKVQNKNDITFALVWSAKKIDFQEFPNLKAINSMGAGVDHILKNKTLPSHIPIAKIVDTKLISSMWEYLLSIVMNIVTNQYHYITQQKKQYMGSKSC